MKKILYILSILCLPLMASCNQEWVGEDSAPEVESGTITLTLRSIEPQTRATQPGEAALNENLIKSIHYFFYPKDGTDTNTEKEPAKMGQATGLAKQGEHTITVNASEDEIKNVLFKYPYNDCDVYVIVNLPSEFEYDGATYTSLDALPDRKLSTLKKIAVATSFESKLTQDAFVMEGLNVATIIDRNKVLAAQGTIPVDRVAAKISVSVKVKERIDLGEVPELPDNQTSGQIWTSNPDQMIIELVNGVNRTVLSGNPDDLTLADEDMFTDNNVARTFASTTIDGEEYWTCAPFYTYPAKWEIGSDEEPYLFITLPWTTVIWTELDGQKPPIYRTYNCYYKIMLGSNQLVRNTWYDLKINIGILGSFENTPEVILPIEDIKYFVADWSEGLSIESEILGARYLVVDKEEYVLYNETTLSIPFTSSHGCEIVDAECSYPNYAKKNSDPTINYVTNYSLDVVDGNKIQFSHALNNDMLDRNLDFTPYTITFTIQHKDDDSFKKEITITQYPAIYVEPHYNTGYKNTSGQGYVWVNGYQGSSATSNTDYFAGAGGNTQGADTRMFVFTITTTEGTDLIIGDPREKDYTYDATDAQSIGWFSGPAIYDKASNRELKYYYGTEVASATYSAQQTGTIYANDAEAEAAEPTINMIAPKFRLASGYGTVTQTTNANILEMMKRRCASYQEDGYPAGRWRLPTRAEFQFILTQINYGNLPTVYLQSYGYWCAHGLGSPNNNGLVEMQYVGRVGSGQTFVRCVYDEWYWENSETYRLGTKNADGTFTPSNTFTWGDMPRENFK